MTKGAVMVDACEAKVRKRLVTKRFEQTQLSIRGGDGSAGDMVEKSAKLGRIHGGIGRPVI